MICNYTRFTLAARHNRTLDRFVQYVFQDLYSALNPVHTVMYLLSRPLVNFGGLSERAAKTKVRLELTLERTAVGRKIGE